MGIWTWLKSIFESTETIPISGDDLDIALDDYMSAVGDYYIRELAFASSVRLIANAVSKCEFKTYAGNKEVKNREHYLWNLEPNRNQCSSEFIHKWIWQLYRNNEYLIIEHNGQLFVADSFEKKEYALYDDVFTQVTVKDFTFNKTFTQSEVMYGKLSSQDMRAVINGLYESYKKLIAYGMKYYQKSRGTKGTYEYDSLPPKGSPQEAAFNDLINNKFKTWLEADSAIVPVGKGTKLDIQQSKTYSQEGTRDIRAMIDDISDFTARGLGIPPVLISGKVEGTEDATDNLLTFCIDPLVDFLQEEINRKRYGYSEYKAGNYLKIDTTTIKHIDIFDAATHIDKLISSGVFCVNDILKKLGEPVIDEEWANEHFITRNYMPFAEALVEMMKGGEKT